MAEPVEQITAVLCRVGKLERLKPDDDFYSAGFSSINALELLLELETEFGVGIPDDKFITTRTVRGLAAVISELKHEHVS